MKLKFCLIFAFLCVLLTGCRTTRLAQNGVRMCEDTCHHVHGIDVSHHQNTINWKKVRRQSHAKYVYIKATEGGTYVDNLYKTNLKKAHKKNILVGSYHFFRPAKPILEQMNNIYTNINPKKQDLVPMIDVETADKLPREQMRDSLRIFLKVVEAAYGCKPIIYTGQNFYNQYLSNDLIDGFPLMVANYSNRPVLKDGHAIWAWQYTGKGRVHGVDGNCDKSRLMEGYTLNMLRY